MHGRRNKALIIQFAKAPTPGLVKTRMMPHLTPEQACALHHDLLLWTCRTLTAAGLADVELWLAGDRAHPVISECEALGVNAVRRQCGADLGERMFHAISAGLARYCKVILVGSDCPGIDAAYLEHARQALDHAPLAFGPACDGGYVLIGASAIWRGLFEEVSWGQDTVYEQTIERVQALNEHYRELGELADIDRPEDLPLWEALRDGC